MRSILSFYKFIFLLFFLLGVTGSYAQEKREMSVQDVMNLALAHHHRIKVSEKTAEAAAQNITISKSDRLPTIHIAVDQSYLGNALVLDKNLMHSQNIGVPHYKSTYGIEGSELLFQGGAVQKNIELKKLQSELAQLDVEQDKEYIKFLAASQYLSIYQLDNQIEVFKENRALAKKRLSNVRKFYEQDMVTRNEVIRAELDVKQLEQSLITLKNDKTIATYQLNIALGIPRQTEIIPIENLNHIRNSASLEDFLTVGFKQNPEIKQGESAFDISEKAIELTKTEYWPGISAFAGYNMQRPIIQQQPIQDAYMNTWEVGLGIQYNVDHLFKTHKKVKRKQIQREASKENLDLVKDHVEEAIHKAFRKYHEAIEQLKIYEQSVDLADENYKITNAKYNNQLAIQTEIIDAQNQKLQADLDYVNGKIDVLLRYYTLLKNTGIL